MCLLNVRSLVNKLSKFQSFVYSHSFCILCRLSRGGGVMIAVKSFLFTSLISSPSDLEVVCIKMDIGNDIIITYLLCLCTS